ncbi:MAG: type II secretion system F family protein [Actinomycetes bacterium]
MVGALAAFGALWCWHRAEVGPTRGRLARLGPARSWVPAAIEARLAPVVARLAPGQPVARVLSWWMILAGPALVLGRLAGPVGTVLAVVGVVALGPVAIRVARARADRARRDAVPEFVHGIARALRAGATPAAALGSGPVPEALEGEIAALRSRVAHGVPLADALATWAAERSDPATRTAAGALAVVHLEGGAAAGPLEGLAAALAARGSVADEAAALATQARLSALIIVCAPVVFVALGGIAAPEQLAALTGSWGGRWCLLAGLGLDALGAWWMHRIVDGVR